jgi:hypothetical protein
MLTYANENIYQLGTLMILKDALVEYMKDKKLNNVILVGHSYPQQYAG